MEGRRYRVLETLGAGGFGTVYLAELLGAQGFTKHVALKVMRREDGHNEGLARRLRDEARMLGLMHHRAIVQVDGLADFDEGFAVVMEFVEGVDLSTLRRKVPPPRASLEIVEEVASALHAAYEVPARQTGQPLRLVHRDIKPANIRVTPSGEVKLLDFGVARAQFDGREAHTHAILLGTFAWMAPERLEGLTGPEGDIYSLGLVLANLLAGEKLTPPPKDERKYPSWVADTRVAMTHGLGTQLEGLTFEDRSAIVELVEQMMAFEPEERPTAREVERRCRDLKARIGGPWLRDWAEDTIPALLAERGAPEEDAMTGSILVERSVSQESSAIRRAVSLEEPSFATQQSLPVSEPPSRRWVLLLLLLIAASAVTASAVLGTGGLAALWFTVGPAPEELLGSASSVPAPPEPAVEAPPPSEPGEPAEEAAAAEEAASTGGAEASSAGASPEDAAATEEGTGAEAEPPPPEAPAMAKFAVRGDAKRVRLVGGGKSYAPGEVPPGKYRIQATFEGSEEPVNAGTVRLEVGQSATIRCNAMMLRCS